LGRETDAREVKVPSAEEEDARRLSRTRDRLLADRTSLTNRIGSQLMLIGVSMPTPAKEVSVWLEKLRQHGQWNGAPVPRQMMRDIEMSLQQLELVNRHLDELAAEQNSGLIAQEGNDRRRRVETRQAAQAWAAQATSADQKLAARAAQLNRLRGLGTPSSWLLSGELFGWREFSNRRQVGGYLGMNGIEHSSGAKRRELGISKAGNSRVRALMIELGWLWTEHQPNSELTKWFHKQAPKGSTSKTRRIAIVGLARKLAVALWRFVTQGVVPEGAILKA